MLPRSCERFIFLVRLPPVAGSGGAVTALQLVGKFCTSLTFVVLYMQTAELYPTCVRSLGTGASSLVGIGAGALTPFILQLVSGRSGLSENSLGNLVKCLNPAAQSISGRSAALSNSRAREKVRRRPHTR